MYVTLFVSYSIVIYLGWADCVAYPKREAMREPDCGISEK